jgi:hypothetical protein
VEKGDVLMLKKVCFIGILMLALLGTVHADVISFDDLGGILSGGIYYDQFHPIGFQTDGFQFDMNLMSQDYYQANQNNSSNFPSPEIAVFSNDGASYGNPFNPVTVSTLDGSLFNFIGADFGGYTTSDTIAYFAATELTIEGFADGNFVNSVTFSPLTMGFQPNSIGLFGVDTLVFTAVQGTFDYASQGLTYIGDDTFWMMDNFEYTTNAPEPAILILFGCGLITLALLRRITQPVKVRL